MRFASLIFPLLTLTATAKEQLFEAFEGDGFDTWTETGTAFGTGPSAGGPGRLAGSAQGWAGASFACSFHGGDGAKGMLTSPQFTIELPWIHFMVGGGKHPGQTSVQLIVNGEVKQEAVGENDHLFRPVAWDLRALQGQKANLRILDSRDGSWGFVMADHFVFADNPVISFPAPIAPQKTPAPELIATDAIPGMTIPPGTYAKVFATHADHHIASPTALCFDEQGHILVTETHRLKAGVADNRNHRYWLLDDIASQSTADRLAMFGRYKDRVPPDFFTAKSELVRFLADTDGDGVADTSKVYSDGYNDPLDGISAGIFAFEGTTYHACIPHIWLLRDKDGDGVAEEKTSLFDGFGTRVSLSGHDLNGFALGPDGRIYGTIGDRSMRITNKEGEKIFLPNQGAVFRFDPDGSNFELVHTGLRNPKEIAFDQWGNAVSVDNNSDQGDGARLVYIMEGGDSGWRTDHQNLFTFHREIGCEKRPISQWMEEKQWEPRNDQQPAFLLPPVANFSNGPSGLTYHPGTGLNNDCADSFLVCDYKGGAAASGIWAFGIEPDGAGMSVVNPHKWNWGAAVTDVEFGYDGKVYVTDFIGGWTSHDDGRLYTISSEENDQNPANTEVATLIREGFHQREPAELLLLLGHPDQRVRLRATLALSGKPEALHIFRLATSQRDQRLQRLHGVWGLGIMARREQSAEATETLLSLLGDDDAEVRTQAARALGEAPLTDHGPLAIALRDPSARVRAFAAISLGRLKATDRFNDGVAFLAENNEHDPYLRHAGVMALVGCGTPSQLLSLRESLSPAVRMGAVLALRRLAHPEIVAYLFDDDMRIRNEVIRAVHDTPIEAARPAIAALLHDYTPGNDGRPLTRMMLHRIVHSAFRHGTPESAADLLQFAANPSAGEEERLEALRLLSLWQSPPPVDQSLGRHMPLPPRNMSEVGEAFQTNLPPLLEMNGPILTAAIGLAGQYGLAADKLDDSQLTSIVADQTQSAPIRIRALDLLADRGNAGLNTLLSKLLDAQDDAVANRALQLIAKNQPAQALQSIRSVIGSGNDVRKQCAWSLLADSQDPESATELIRGLASLQGSTQYPAYALELVEAADARPEAKVKTALASFRESLPADDPLGESRLALRGGNPERGAELFQSHPTAQCIRCHRLSTDPSEGTEAGPNLADVGSRRDAEFLLRSLLDPNADIAPGFGLISVTFRNDMGVGGVLMAETDTTLDILSGTDLLRVQKAELKAQTTPTSAMLPTGELLTKREMRDLVSWLTTLKADLPPATTPAKEPILLDPASLLPEESVDEAPAIEPTDDLDPAVMKSGKAAFTLCQACHGPDGKGVPNLGPPLAGSDWVHGPPENLIRIQLRGLTGPIKINGLEYTFAAPMPAQAFQADEQIAAVLTYIRNSFGNAAPPVITEMVTALRNETGKPLLTVADLIPLATTPTSTVTRSTFLDPDEEDSGGWPWWATALILLWLAACAVPLVKQFKKQKEDEEEE